MKEFLRKSYRLSELKAVTDGEPGTFEAIVSVFGNVDEVGDRVVKGAFERTLQDRGLPPVVYSHQWDQVPIGIALDAEERDEGLWVRARLFIGADEDHAIARQAYAALKGGALREFSFAFQVRDSRAVTEEGEEIRELVDVDLFEVGPTLVGMNPATELLQVASALTHLEKHKQSPSYIQQAHDALVKAGCKCVSAADEDEDGKAADSAGDTAAKLALVKTRHPQEA